MMISCNDCRQRLGEMFEKSGDGAAASADVQEHLAGCEKCRADLKLVTAARDEMRAFPALSAPADLRARIRRELESAPAASAAHNGTSQAGIPAAANVAAASATIVRPQLFEPAVESHTGSDFPKSMHSYPAMANHAQQKESAPRIPWQEKFGTFLRNPTNVTWMSCAVILLFYFASLSLPRYASSPVEEAPAQSIAGSEHQKEAADSAPSQQVFTAPQGSAPKQATGAGAKIPAIPSKIPAPPPGPAPAGQPQSSSSATVIESKPYPQKPSADILEGIEFGSPSAPQSTPGIVRIPEPAAAPAPKPAPRVAQARPAPRKPQSPTASTPAPRPNAPQNNSQRFATRSTPSGAAQAYGPSGPAGPPAAFSAPAPRMDAESSLRDSNRPVAKAEAESTKRRSISTRISSPRNLGWAQVSVNLPDGVRFSDGSKARVVWRGTAQANEPIELDFDVLITAGAREIRITLQEVKNQDAQVVAYKTMPVG